MSTTSKLPNDAPTNISKLYIDKIKREEEEDQWISGEELNTDGSSDEDVGGGSRRPRQGHPTKGGARPKAQAQKSKRPPFVAPPPPPPTDSSEEPVQISWKPKRGSIRLPHVITDNETNATHASHVP